MSEDADNNYLKIYREAKAYACRVGFPNEAEDFGQWLVLKKLSGKRKNQKMYFSYTDYLRETKGNSRSKNFRAASDFREIDDELMQSTVTDLIDRRKFERLSKKLTDQQIQVFGMYFLQNKRMHEIGDELGVSESRICQLMVKVREIVKQCIDPFE